jgi:ubiquitin C-terminal hydrolase
VNTCYLNSLLQSVLNIPQLLDAVTSIQKETKFRFESRFGKNGNPVLIEKGISNFSN